MRRHWLATLAFLAGVGCLTAEEPKVIVPAAPAAKPEIIYTEGGANYIGHDYDAWAMSENPGGRGWVRAEYLYWWFKDGPNGNALVVTGPGAGGLNPALGGAGTSIVIGGRDLDYDNFSGFRLSGGRNLGCGNLSLEASGFMTEQRSENFRAASDGAGSPTLARPFINVTPGLGVAQGEQGFSIASPGVFAGSIDVRSTSQLWGAEVNAAANMWNSGSLKASVLAGVRFIELEEDLTFVQQSTSLVAGVNFGAAGAQPLGTVATLTDIFAAENQFYGGQIGARFRFERGSLSVEATGKLGIGTTRQQLRVAGATAIRGAGGNVVATAPGGFLALGSNSGEFDENDFTLVPEGTINVSYCLGERIRLTAGYTFLYWDNVLRPGDQLDRGVNISQVPVASGGALVGPARPAPVLSETHFWAQGVSGGIEIKY